MRIIVMAHQFLNWNGGRDFLRLCINSLLLNGEKVSSIYLLCPASVVAGMKKQIFDMISNFSESVFIVTHENNQESFLRTLNSIKADVIIPTFWPLGGQVKIPWVGYLYDFQHKYYPDYFSAEEMMKREREFSGMLTKAKVVVVNSKAVKKDIEKFYPEARSEIVSLPFASMQQSKWFEEFSDVKKQYGVPSSFFMISNQFWVHKSHITAFKALEILKNKYNREVNIVCTGDTTDYRFPDYYSELSKKIEELGIREQVFILGFIPKMDQISLLKEAVAVIQPTLFEGGPGGGAAYDSIAVGTPVIASDIPVNLELPHECTSFFRTGDAHSLAKEMIKKFDLKQRKKVDNAELMQIGRERARNFGKMMLSAAKLAQERFN